MNPKIYANRPAWLVVAALAAIALLLATAWVAVCAWHSHDPRRLYVLGAIWAVGPPTWFWCEYFFLYLPKGNPAGFEQFKYGQQVSVAIWAGVALALFAYVSSDHFKPDKPPAAVSCTQCPAQTPSGPQARQSPGNVTDPGQTH